MKKETKKQEKKGSKFLTGALVGAVLGVAAGVFATTKTGKKLGKDKKDGVSNKATDFYKYIVPKLKKAKDMGEKEYKDFIDQALVVYSKNKKLTVKEVSELKKEANKYWKLLKKHF
jgi:gas vesicle protein